MDIYTMVLRQNGGYWVALCLENGIVGQANTVENAIDKLKDAIKSFQVVYETEKNIYSSPISIEELHEFLMLGDKEQSGDSDACGGLLFETLHFVTLRERERLRT